MDSFKSYLSGILKDEKRTIIILLSLFLFFLAFDILSTPIGSMLGQLSYTIFFSLFKITYVCQFLIMGLLLFYTRSVNSFLICLFLVGIFALTNGLLSNYLDKSFLVHGYSWLLILLGYNTGRLFSSTYVQDFFPKIDKFVIPMFIVLMAELCIYYYLTQSGHISYFGMSTLMFYFSYYFLVKKKYLFFALSILGVLMSGKRSDLVVIVAVSSFFIIWTWINKENLKRALLKVLALAIAFSSAIVVLANYTTILNRFLNIFQQDLSSEYGLYIATSGRSHEIKYLLRHMEEAPYKWYIGGGWGDTYIQGLGIDTFLGYWRTKFVHFSPLSYVLIYGLPIAILLYYYIFRTLFSSMKNLDGSNSSYALVFLFFMHLFLLSFFGANILVEPSCWFFFGALASLKYAELKA